MRRPKAKKSALHQLHGIRFAVLFSADRTLLQEVAEEGKVPLPRKARKEASHFTRRERDSNPAQEKHTHTKKRKTNERNSVASLEQSKQGRRVIFLHLNRKTPR